jgi:magnesium transporter
MVEQENNEAMRRMAELGLQQNEQVKKVSGWAAILFAPTLVGTVYGMNFEDMPELGWQFGYPMALLLMVGVSATLYLVFKRRDWI